MPPHGDSSCTIPRVHRRRDTKSAAVAGSILPAVTASSRTTTRSPRDWKDSSGMAIQGTNRMGAPAPGWTTSPVRPPAWCRLASRRVR